MVRNEDDLELARRFDMVRSMQGWATVGGPKRQHGHTSRPCAVVVGPVWWGPLWAPHHQGLLLEPGCMLALLGLTWLALPGRAPIPWGTVTPKGKRTSSYTGLVSNAFSPC